MKKTIVILLMLCTSLIGFCRVTKDVTTNKSEVQIGNLIIKEQLSKTLTEEELLTYIDSIDYEIESLISKQEKLTVEEQKILENTFITITDFIFYDEKITGKTFEELKTESKQKILNIYEKIDNKIESKLPGYKEKIFESATKKYKNVKVQVEKLKKIIKNKCIEDYEQDKYEQKEDVYNEAKESATGATKSNYNALTDIISDFYERTQNWDKKCKGRRV